MGQKVNPHGLRVGVIKDWDSRWYAREDKVGDLIVEDDKIRKYLKKRLYAAGVPAIEIERDNTQVRIYIHCSRPGVIIGKGGTEIEKLRQDVEALIGKKVAVSIVEVRTPDTSAQLVAENIAQQLEKRIGFRRAMTDKYAAWVGSDFKQEGLAAGEWLNAYAEANGITEINALVISGTTGASAQIGRSDGFKEVADKYGWTILDEQTGMTKLFLVEIFLGTITVQREY